MPKQKEKRKTTGEKVTPSRSPLKRGSTPTTGALVHDFFEHPKGFWARGVQGVIIFLILLSVALVALETFFPDIYDAYLTLFEITNTVILAAFTVEYLFRMVTAARTFRFMVRPMNIIDFIAVAPNYLEILLPLTLDTTSVRVIRLLRPLRLLRVVRAFKIFRYKSFVQKTFHYQGTILQAITPVLVLFAAAKGGVWAFEQSGPWFANPNLGVLFTIIGFALGIVLSQKITSTHAKFLQVEEASARLYSALRTLATLINHYKPQFGYGTRVTAIWAKKYLAVLENPGADNFAIIPESEKLFAILTAVPNMPDYTNELFSNIQNDAAFCLGKKARLTPKAYDTLLHQATILYLILLVLFIPGLAGLLSTLVATYILYGMYYLTQDLDSMFSDNFSLTSVDLSELRRFAESA